MNSKSFKPIKASISMHYAEKVNSHQWLQSETEPDPISIFKNFLISSYRTSTKAPPVPRRTFEKAPRKKAFSPSWPYILMKQSMVPLYWRVASPLCSQQHLDKVGLMENIRVQCVAGLGLWH